MSTDQPTERESPEQATAHPGASEAAGHGVTVRGLEAFYGNRQVIKGLDLDIRANQVTAIIGPSGSGKSTVIRCINRMHEEIPGARAQGTIQLEGLNVYAPEVDITAVRRLIGMVFQKPNPFPTMSIFNNVAADCGSTASGGETPSGSACIGPCGPWACGRRSRTGWTPGHGTVRRSAAATVHRQDDCH